MTRALRTAALVAPLTLLFAPSLAQAELTRGPYVQLATQDGMTVVWRTDAPSMGTLRYGDAPDALGQSVSSTAAKTQHELRITGLSANTRYCYAVEDDAGRLAGGDESFCFTTAPSAPRPFTFWVVGDSGTGSGKQGRVRDAMWIDVKGDLPDLYLHVGDMAYSSGTNDEFQEKFFEMYPRVLRQVPTFPAIGNHEGGTSDSLTATGPYYDAYVLPTEGEVGGLASGTEAYYSWDYGDVHFIALESHRGELRAIDGAMLTWLEMDLAATDARWVVVYFHHPPYTKGSHDSDTEIAHVEMREWVLPILEAHGVDLVLGGHSHIYERSFLVHGAYDTPTTAPGHIVDEGDGKKDAPYHKGAPGGAEDGAIYIVAGHGGTNVGRDGSVEHDLMYFTEVANGTVLVEVDGPTMKLRNVRLDGEISDEFSIVKGEALHLTGPRGRLVAGTEVDITWISRGSNRTVDVSYSTDAGVTWSPVGSGLADAGRTVWRVPDIGGAQVIFRIEDSANPGVTHTTPRPVEVAPDETVTFVPFGSKWRRFVEAPPEGWSQPGFEDRSWPRDAARFGVCPCLPWEAATETFLADALGTKTVYFRTTFTPVANASELDLTVIAESGVVVYLNGQEVLRRNVDDDRHEAGASAKGVEVHSVRLPADAFDPFFNTLAVAVKKADDRGVNLTFDLRLNGIVQADSEQTGCGCRDTGASGGEAGMLGLLALLGLRLRRRAR